MDNALEEKIIRSFANKIFQGRLLFELTSPKRRTTFIQKMCHGYDNYLKNSCILQRSKTNPAFSELQQMMVTHDAAKKFYVLSLNDGMDGVYVDLEPAVEKLSSNGFASFIVGLPSGFTHFKGESYASYQPNFYLKPYIRFDGKPWAI